MSKKSKSAEMCTNCKEFGRWSDHDWCAWCIGREKQRRDAGERAMQRLERWKDEADE